MFNCILTFTWTFVFYMFYIFSIKNFPHNFKMQSNLTYEWFTTFREKIDDENEHTSLITLSCPEAHFSACNIDKLHLVKNFTEDGYIFKSPFASAAGYMATGHPALLKYLKSVVQKFPCGGLSRLSFSLNLERPCIFTPSDFQIIYLFLFHVFGLCHV